jgi:hypothetical protein
MDGPGLIPGGARFPFTASRRILGPLQPPIQWVPKIPFTEVRRHWRETDHLFPSSAEVKEGEAITLITYFYIATLYLTYYCELRGEDPEGDAEY